MNAQVFLVVAVEVWEPGNFQDDGAKRVGVCFASNTDLELWTDGVEQGVIDNMIIFQKPFPGAARTELEPAAARRQPAGNRAPRPAEFARRRGRALVARHVWLMGRQCSLRCATSLSLEGVSQMVYVLPERLLALVRPAFDLVLRRIRSLKRCVQA